MWSLTLTSGSSWGAEGDAFVWRTRSAVRLLLVPQQTQRRSGDIERQMESNSDGKKIGGWVHVSVSGTFCTAMCSFLLDSQSTSESPIINTLLLSINATKRDQRELAKPLPLVQRPLQSKPTPTSLRSRWELRKKTPGAGILGASCSFPQPRRFGWLPFKPRWHVLSLSNCQPDGPSRTPAACRSVTRLRWWWRSLERPLENPLLEMTPVFQGNRFCWLGLGSLSSFWQQTDPGRGQKGGALKMTPHLP